MRRMRTSWITSGGRDPLRRRVDRIEASVLIGLAAFFVITAPLLVVFAVHLTDAAGLRELRADDSLSQVPATLLANASTSLPMPGSQESIATAPARWTAPSGQARTGVVDTTPGVRAGQRVTIWVTRAGKLADPPLSRADLAERVAFTALAAVLVLVVLLSAVAAAVRVAAGRRRMADWAKEWAAISPRWSQSR